jgi:hypothetical protein
MWMKLDGSLVFWLMLDLFLVALVLLIVGGASAHYRAGHRRSSGLQRIASGASLALYAVGFVSGLALPLAATLAQTLRALDVLPQQLPSGTTRWVAALILSTVALSALSLMLGLVLEWRANRRSTTG